MKLQILAILLLTSTALQDSTDENVPLVAIIMQPADVALNVSYFNSSQNFNFVASSYVSWFSQTGAMPLLVPFDLPLDTLERILRDSDMVFFPGGANIIFDAATFSKPTFYQERVSWMIDLAKKINDEGKQFLVAGTCLGYEQMLVAFANNNPGVIKCDLNDENQHPVIKGRDYDKSKFFAMFDQKTVEEVFAKGYFYYHHLCRITPDDFDKFLKDEFYITSYGYTDKEEIYISTVEHQKYPFFGQQYHPEKAQYEREEAQLFLSRDLQSLTFFRDFVFKYVDMMKPFARNIDDVPDFIRSYFYLYHEEERIPGGYFESNYVVQGYSPERIKQDD